MDPRYSRAVLHGNPDGLSPSEATDANSPRSVWVGADNSWQTDGLTWKQAYDHDRTHALGPRWMNTLQDTVTDSDLDGMTDFYEVQNGLDPTDPNDAFDAPVGHIPLVDGVPVRPVKLNDFILNIEKARLGIPLSTVINDPGVYQNTFGRPAPFSLPLHDFTKPVAENDWDGDGVSNRDEILFGTDLWDNTQLPSNTQLIDAYIACHLSATTIANFYDSLFSGLDTNNDGIPDGIERTYGINAGNIDSVRSIVNPTDGLAYTDGLTWREAYALSLLDSLAQELTFTVSPASVEATPGQGVPATITVSNGVGEIHMSVLPDGEPQQGGYARSGSGNSLTITYTANEDAGGDDWITVTIADSYNGREFRSGTATIPIVIIQEPPPPPPGCTCGGSDCTITDCTCGGSNASQCTMQQPCTCGCTTCTDSTGCTDGSCMTPPPVPQPTVKIRAWAPGTMSQPGDVMRIDYK